MSKYKYLFLLCQALFKLFLFFLAALVDFGSARRVEFSRKNFPAASRRSAPIFKAFFPCSRPFIAVFYGM
jgi:hypothetical protein